MIGQTINNYLLERKLGEGGMSEVFFARHNRIDRVVAIKILHKNLFDNESVRTRFKNEANALIKLEHPNIVKIFDYIEQDNFACLIVEYIDGITLDDFINKFSGPIPETKATGIICTVLDAVQYAHDNRILHRDIKPGNIMVSKDGKTVKVMDFGIAKFTDLSVSNVTHINTQLGTPFYMSPEQVRGLPYSTYSDIYSIGVTLYEMTTGKCPYMGIKTLFELHSKIVNEPLPPTSLYYPDVSPKLQEAIKLATNKTPEQRFKTCNDFKEFLQKSIVIQPEQLINPKRTIVLQDTQPGSGTKKKKNILIFSSIVLLGAIAFFFILKTSFSNSSIEKKTTDSTAIKKNIILFPTSTRLDSSDLLRKADSIIAKEEIIKNATINDTLKRNELKQSLFFSLTKDIGEQRVDSIIKIYDRFFISQKEKTHFFVFPPAEAEVKTDLASQKLSNGISYSSEATITNYLPKVFDKNDPPIMWFATVNFKRNDTTFQAVLNYIKVGGSYRYNSNQCKVIAVPIEAAIDPTPGKARIKDDLVRYFSKQKKICNIQFTGEKDITEINVGQKVEDANLNITFRINFVFKSESFSCRIIYTRSDEVNSAKYSYNYFNLIPNCK